MGRRRPGLCGLTTLLCAAVAGDLGARSRDLALRFSEIPLPGPPAAIVSGDVDRDGIDDLVIVIAYTEWDQIVTEESVEMDQVEGLVAMMTIVPALADRRELLFLRGLVEGGFSPPSKPVELGLDVVALAPGPADSPVVALTDEGLHRLETSSEDSEEDTALRFVPMIEGRSVLSYTGVFLSDLQLFYDLDAKGRASGSGNAVGGTFILPGERSLLVHPPAASRRDRVHDARPAEPFEVKIPEDESEPLRRGRHYPLPRVADVDGDGRADLTLRTADENWSRFWVARSRANGGFDEPVELEPDLEELSLAGQVVWFGDLDGDGRGEYVLQAELLDPDAGWRKVVAEAKVPRFRYAVHGADEELAIVERERLHFETIGYGFESNDEDVPMPFGFQDLDGDGRLDLVSLTLDFSWMQAVRVLATKSISIGIDFHLWCQADDGSFRKVTGADLSGKFKLDLNDLAIGQLSQFAGDFDGDGRADFVQMGRGRNVSVHLGRAGCSYPEAPDLELKLREEPHNLALVDVRDLDGDALADLSIVQPREGSRDGATSPVRLELYLSRGSPP